MIRQLSGRDAGFLYMETATTYGHVMNVGIFDPATAPGAAVTFDDIKRVLEERIHLLPLLRRRVVEVPLALDHPYWADDPDFDLDFHLRHVAVPAPGDTYQLAEQAARIAARHLDRSRPLWELYVIDGLADDHLALLAKVHHCAVDEVSGVEVMAMLLDLAPDPTPVAPPDRPWRPDRLPSGVEMLARGLCGVATRPARLANLQRRVCRELAGPFGRRLRRRGREGRVLSRPPQRAPRAPFNRSLTSHRRWAFGTLALADMTQVKNAFGTTVNDVVLALSAGALRRWLLAHDELPDAPLLALVPFLIATEAQPGRFANQAAAVIAPLHTHIGNPIERLRRIHADMKDAKERFRALPADILRDVTRFRPPALATLAARLSARFRMADAARPPFNVVISNVPGPPSELYSAGARMVAAYTISAINDGVGLNIAVGSYQGNLDYGFLTGRELIPDLWDMAAYFEDALTELKAAAADTSP